MKIFMKKCPKAAKCFPESPPKGKTWSLKCRKQESNHPSEVHPDAFGVCLHTMFEQAPVAGLAVACVETVLEHDGFYVVPSVLFFGWQALYLFP